MTFPTTMMVWLRKPVQKFPCHQTGYRSNILRTPLLPYSFYPLSISPFHLQLLFTQTQYIILRIQHRNAQSSFFSSTTEKGKIFKHPSIGNAEKGRTERKKEGYINESSTQVEDVDLSRKCQ